MNAPAARKLGRPPDPDLSARRRTEILDAAATVFAAAGYADADVQHVADRVGVGKATVYRYFSTKKDLFLAAVKRGLDELSAEMDAIVGDETAAPVSQIEKAIRAYLSFFRRRPEMAELFIQERAAFREHHVPLYFDAKDENECQHLALFRRLEATGRLRAVSQERFFQVVGDLLYGTILTNLLTGRPADPTEQATAILDIVFHGTLKPRARK